MAVRVERRRLLLSTAELGAAIIASSCKRSETCPTSQLSPEDAKLRETMHYTDHGLDPQKLCNGCQQYLANTDQDCGGCKLMKGFVHPAGSCAVFSAIG